MQTVQIKQAKAFENNEKVVARVVFFNNFLLTTPYLWYKGFERILTLSNLCVHSIFLCSQILSHQNWQIFPVQLCERAE